MLPLTSFALAAPSVPAATLLARAEPPGLCLSSVPSAGALPRPLREPFTTAATTLANLGPDPKVIGQWWTTYEPLLVDLPGHPALEGLRATVDALRSPTVAPGPFVALADAFPKDPCLSASAAAVTFAAGDRDAARTYVGRAWIPMPTADLAYMLGEMALASGETGRVSGLLAAGFALDPDHAGLRRLRAALTLQAGGSAAEDLAFLQQQGDRSLDPMLMMAHYEENRMDDYLRLAVQVSPPLGLLPDPTVPSPLATLRAALGSTDPTDPVRVVLDTSEGSIPCTLFLDQAPYTVAMFAGFATGAQPWRQEDGTPGEGPLYHDVRVHRVIPGFMIQTGDPRGDGTGGPGFKFHDEVRPDLRFDRPGRLAMANAGPGTNGSQFFVTEGPTPHLDGKHTIFGQCEALGVVSAIARLPRDSRDQPNAPVVLRAVRLELE